MAGLCEGGNEPPGSLKASKRPPFCRGCELTVTPLGGICKYCCLVNCPKTAVNLTSDTNKATLMSTSEWKDNATSVADWPRREAVAEFRLATGHDCLGKHLYRIGLLQNPNCLLCNQNIVMDSDHLMDCPPQHW
ncbi:hypothetical protein ANN_12340 [Periplaneta americana]|uniref:4Fe-4S ferredoxin-type domain-containing protein n=1 Tax=Periplaneta americana TaxID=6978 RepID=A0ABQ8THN4_PERAM|nr:hypothetical protein ANN_12340 [Periplaneta americana]